MTRRFSNASSSHLIFNAASQLLLIYFSVMTAVRAESSTVASGKAKAAQDSAASTGYELPWYVPAKKSVNL
jgi:hypothetical protein